MQTGKDPIVVPKGLKETDMPLVGRLFSQEVGVRQSALSELFSEPERKIRVINHILSKPFADKNSPDADLMLSILQHTETPKIETKYLRALEHHPDNLLRQTVSVLLKTRMAEEFQDNNRSYLLRNAVIDPEDLPIFGTTLFTEDSPNVPFELNDGRNEWA